MPYIFLSLACGQLIVLLATGALGMVAAETAADRHVLLAVFALLLSCLIQVIVLTYLTVTGKMIAQAVHLAKLDLHPIRTSRHLKRSTTRLLGCVIATVVLVTATGAYHLRTGSDGTVHFAVAGVLLLVHVFALYKEYGLILENRALVERTLELYQSVLKHTTQEKSHVRCATRRIRELTGQPPGAERGDS